jgi:DNA-binding transcriptional regulator YdaS (Cro superfamily)
MLPSMDLKTYLESNAITQKEFAKLIDVHESMISQWINGVRSVPAERCSEIERASGGAVTCEDLRPDLADHWSYLRGTAAA